MKNSNGSSENNEAMMPGTTVPSATDTGVFQKITETGSFRVLKDGEIKAESVPSPIDPGMSWYGSQGVLPIDAAQSQHLLALGSDVQANEVEALAVSLWDEAGWVGPGSLHLTEGASLSGPWQITREIGRALDLPTYASQGYLVFTSRNRSGLVPTELRGTDAVMDAFSQGAPTGEELEVIEGLRRIGRRLSGCLRIFDSGKTIVFDPDSAVMLTAVSPNFIPMEAMLTILRSILPDIRDANDVSNLSAASDGTTVYNASTDVSAGQTSHAESHSRRSNSSRQSAADSPRRRLRRTGRHKIDAIAGAEFVETHLKETLMKLGIDAEELARITAESAAYDEEMLKRGPQSAGFRYYLSSEQGRASAVVLAVEPLAYVPCVLRWEPWAAEKNLMSYQFSWEWPDPEQVYSDHLSRSLRLERVRVTRVIEAAASAVSKVVGGALIDEDEFLVSL